MLISALTSALLIDQIATASETPSQALAILQYGLRICALFVPAGSVALLASGK